MQFTKTKLQNYKLLTILISSSITLYACMNGTPHGNSAVTTNMQTTQNTINESDSLLVMSQLKHLPAVNSANAVYPLVISNLGADTYTLQSIRVEDVFKKSEKSRDVLQVELLDPNNKEISAHGEFRLKLTPKTAKSATAKLVVEFINNHTKKIKKLQQIIQISNHNYTNQGLTYDDGNNNLHIKNRYYDFSIPILLQKSYTDLSVTNGELDCINGYSAGNACTLHLSGNVSESANYTYTIFGKTTSQESAFITGNFQPDSRMLRNNGLLVQEDLVIDQDEDNAIIVVSNAQTEKNMSTTLQNENNLKIEDSTCKGNVAADSECYISVFVPDASKAALGQVVVDYAGNTGKASTITVSKVAPPATPSIEFVNAPSKLTAYSHDTEEYSIEVKNSGTSPINLLQAIIPGDVCKFVSFNPNANTCNITLSKIDPSGGSAAFKLYFKPKLSKQNPILQGDFNLLLQTNIGFTPFTFQKKIAYEAQALTSNVLGMAIDQKALAIVPGTDSKSTKLRLTNVLKRSEISIPNKLSIVDIAGNPLNIFGVSITNNCKKIAPSSSCEEDIMFGPVSDDLAKTDFSIQATKFKAGDVFTELTKTSDSMTVFASQNANRILFEYKGVYPVKGNLTTEDNNGLKIYGMPIGGEAALVYHLTNNYDEPVEFKHFSQLLNGGMPTGSYIDGDCLGKPIKAHEECDVKLVRKISAGVNPVRYAISYEVIKAADQSLVVGRTPFGQPSPPVIVYGYAVDENGNPKVDVTVGTDYDKSSGRFNPDKISTIGNEGDSFTVYATVSGYNPSDDLPLSINSTFNATGDSDGRYPNTMHIERIDSCRTKLTDTTPARCQYRFTQNTPIQYNRDFDGHDIEHYYSDWNKNDTIKGFYFHFPDIRYVTFSTDTSNVTLHDFVGAGKKKIFNYFLGTTRREYDNDVRILDGRRFDYFNCSKQSRNKVRYNSGGPSAGFINQWVSQYYSKDDNDPELKLNMPGHYAQLPNKTEYPGLIFERCNKKLAERVTKNWEDHFGWQICTHCVRPWFTRGGGWVENTME